MPAVPPEIREWFDAVQALEGSFTLCCGAPGSGKTNLARLALLAWPRPVFCVDPAGELRYYGLGRKPIKRTIHYLKRPMPSWTDANHIRPPDCPPGSLIIVDELAQWMEEGKEERQAVRTLCRLRRPWRLHVIATTQRPTQVAWALDLANHLMLYFTDGPHDLDTWWEAFRIPAQALTSLPVGEALWVQRGVRPAPAPEPPPAR